MRTGPRLLHQRDRDKDKDKDRDRGRDMMKRAPMRTGPRLLHRQGQRQGHGRTGCRWRWCVRENNRGSHTKTTVKSEFRVFGMSRQFYLTSRSDDYPWLGGGASNWRWRKLKNPNTRLVGANRLRVLKLQIKSTYNSTFPRSPVFAVIEGLQLCPDLLCLIIPNYGWRRRQLHAVGWAPRNCPLVLVLDDMKWHLLDATFDPRKLLSHHAFQVLIGNPPTASVQVPRTGRHGWSVKLSWLSAQRSDSWASDYTPSHGC
jgi:hypothetical protein